jgi:hypothetical protein
VFVALPYINAAQAAHPALTGHIRVLGEAGVSVLLGEGGHVPHPPGYGNAAAFPWKQALHRLPKPELQTARLTRQRDSGTSNAPKRIQASEIAVPVRAVVSDANETF